MARIDPRRQTATAIYQQGIGAGLTPARADELVAAAAAESSLNPQATNKSSGAAGLFQLLSPGYRQRAQQFGGLYNPVANTRAILPDYVNYWHTHPNAAPGTAARDVERSGQGAGFYSGQLSLARALVGGSGAGATVAPPAAVAPAVTASSPPTVSQPPSTTPTRFVDIRHQLALALLNGGDLTHLEQQVQQQRLAPPASAAPAVAAARSQPAPRFTPNEPLPQATSGGFVDPVTGKLIGLPFQGTHAVAFNQAGGSNNWESERAVDVSVPLGTPVRAPFNGVIGPQFGSLGEGGRFAGLRAHVVGNSNEAYLAHLSRFAPGIQPGTRVKAGQVIGFSGEANGVPHLHEALLRGNPLALVGKT